MSLQDDYFDLSNYLEEELGEDSWQYQSFDHMWKTLCRYEEGYENTTKELSKLKFALNTIGKYLK